MISVQAAGDSTINFLEDALSLAQLAVVATESAEDGRASEPTSAVVAKGMANDCQEAAQLRAVLVAEKQPFAGKLTESDQTPAQAAEEEQTIFQEAAPSHLAARAEKRSAKSLMDCDLIPALDAKDSVEKSQEDALSQATVEMMAKFVEDTEEKDLIAALAAGESVAIFQEAARNQVRRVVAAPRFARKWMA